MHAILENILSVTTEQLVIASLHSIVNLIDRIPVSISVNLFYPVFALLQVFLCVNRN